MTGFNKYLNIIILFSACYSCGTAGQQATGSLSGVKSRNFNSLFINPVLNKDFADPTVIKAADGFYYAYATNTGNKDGSMTNIQVAKSKNLVQWELLGDALPQRPTWANKDFWAPHVSYDGNLKKYFLYYSGESINDSMGKCLGVAVSSLPAGPFVDKGSPLICGETFVNIDPMAFDDPVTGKKLLYWGSAFKPIKVQELSADRINFKAGSIPTDLVSPVINKDPSNYQKLIEGAWVEYNNGYYYMYFSGDNCCGEKAHYGVMIARSKLASGPFENKSGEADGKYSVILGKNSNWIAPGHNSVVKDGAGVNWIIYHAIDSAQRNGGRKMLIDKIIYHNGWPTIGNGTPSTDSTNAPGQ
ncbi:glycoside hydrolase family 43 protein [Flavitalea sp.]|nr:glycoside hydrolase family 43 protein [Flavitalea sp.]